MRRCRSAICLLATACALTPVAKGELTAGAWVRFRVLRAEEWKPPPVAWVALTIGQRETVDGETSARWWQLEASKEDGARFVVQALSDHAPLERDDGDLGRVYQYRYHQRDRAAVAYLDKNTGRAYLPRFSFRRGLVPTPRASANRVRGLLSTASYLGHPISAQGSGTAGAWLNMGDVTVVELDDDLLIGTVYTVRDDGTGPNAAGEYRYVEKTAEDYDRAIAAGFNLFTVNQAHLRHVRRRNVFFVYDRFDGIGYPELLYHANFYGTRTFIDEPASRLDASDCRTLHDVVFLLRARNHAYFNTPGGARYDLVRLINGAGFSLGDFQPLQEHVVIWETYHETAMYQIHAGAAGMVHEGRYSAGDVDSDLEAMLGPGARLSAERRLDIVYAFLRGAARVMKKEWGTAIYGQCDPAIAPTAVTRAYDQGARYVWFWTSDHGHHVPFERQLDLSMHLQRHRAAHPRGDRNALRSTATVAVAVPEGYSGTANMMWWSQRFYSHRRNEHGVPYGDVRAAYWWEIFRLAQGTELFDCVVDMPIIHNAGYKRIVHVDSHGRSSSPPPALLLSQPTLAATLELEFMPPQSRPGAPVLIARHRGADSIHVDGKLAEWQDAQWITLMREHAEPKRPKPLHKPGKHAARAAVAYDKATLYIAAEVTDETHEALFDGDDMWRSDSLQIGLDPLLNPSGTGEYAFDDTELGLALIDGVPRAHIWEQRTTGLTGAWPAAEVAIVRAATQTLYEAALPLAALRPLYVGYPGFCGFNIAVNNADGGNRVSARAWSGGLADSKRVEDWGVLVFDGASRLGAAGMVVHATPMRTVVKRGEPAIFALKTGTAESRQLQLHAAVVSGETKSRARSMTLPAPPGLWRWRLALDTGELEPGAYRCELVASASEQECMRQSLRFYVLPSTSDRPAPRELQRVEPASAP